MFEFFDFSGFGGSVAVGVKKAADIMSVTVKTAKKYLKDPSTADPCRMAYLEAVACRRIIPKDWQVWIEGDTLHTDSGYSFNKREIESIGWLRATFKKTQIENEQLKKRIKELENKQTDIEKKADKLPNNVIRLKPR